MLSVRTLHNEVCRLCFQGYNDKNIARIFEEPTEKLDTDVHSVSKNKRHNVMSKKYLS